jgi:hypothetical protein
MANKGVEATLDGTPDSRCYNIALNSPAPRPPVRVPVSPIVWNHELTTAREEGGLDFRRWPKDRKARQCFHRCTCNRALSTRFERR